MKQFTFFSIFLLSGLWLTAQTPVMVKDINSGSTSSDPRSMAALNGILYFAASDADGIELWRSDGTDAGTYIVKDINPGSADSDPDYLTEMNGMIYFAANDGTNGRELWVTDGTSGGTNMVANIYSGSASSSPQFLVNVGGTLFFSATNGGNVFNSSHRGREPYKSDGTASGTVRARDIYLGYRGSNPTLFTASAGNAFFSAFTPSVGEELYRGSSSSVSLLSIRSNVFSANPDDLVDVNGTLYLTADDGNNGREVWKSNSSGTSLLKDIFPGSTGSAPRNLGSANGSLYFAAQDNTSMGIELWKSDGTSAGTQMVHDINTGSGSSSPNLFTEAGNIAFFAADDGTNGQELWKTNGSSSGTSLIKNIYPGMGSSSIKHLTAIKKLVYFSANDSVHGEELWESDGTDLGTRMLMDIATGTDSASPAHIFNLNGVLYFTADDGVNGRELWKYEDTCNVLTAQITNTIDSAEVCLGETFKFLSETSFEDAVYQWQLNEVDIASATDTFYTASVAGDYRLVVRDTLRGCSDTSMNVKFIIHPFPTASIASDVLANTVCDGELVTFTGTGGSDYEFIINGMSVQDSSLTTYEIVTLVDQDTVSVIVTDNGCSTQSAKIVMNVEPLPTVTLTSDDPNFDICYGDEIIFTAGTGANYDFQVNGSSVQNGSSNTYNTDQLMDRDEVGVVVTGANGCIEEILRIVRVRDLPAKPTINYSAQALISTGANSYQWFLNGTAIPGATSRTYQPTANGLYSVEVKNGFGCANLSDEFDYTITGIETFSEATTFNISPNPGDGNFVLTYQNVPSEVKRLEISIHDVLGRKMEQKSVNTTQNNGRLNLNLLDWKSGIYTISIQYKDQMYHHRIVKR